MTDSRDVQTDANRTTGNRQTEKQVGRQTGR